MKTITKIIAIAIVLTTSGLANKGIEVVPKGHYLSPQHSAFSHEDTKLAQMDSIKGFLTAKSCALEGTFSSCDLQKRDSDELVLYVHDENKMYSFKVDKALKASSLDNAFNKNEVQLFGTLNKNGTLVVAGLSAPKKAAATFFKGCL